MDTQEIINYINQNVVYPEQLEGMRGMGVSLEELPKSYNAKKQRTDSGIDYYICHRNEETKARIVRRLEENLGKEFTHKQYLKGMSLDMEHLTLKERLNNILQESKQVIFTGAPGTGKTYTVMDYVKNQQRKNSDVLVEFVQFHASYDYSDFMEGLRPVQVENSDNPTFVRLDGIFKRFCREVVKINQKCDNDNLPYQKHYFVIDEINRADLSNVFGELMFALEETNRGADNSFPTQYANLNTYEVKNGQALLVQNDCFQDGFYVPENVYILGTMNDIDRSVEAFDFALRRRFRWVEVKANDEMRFVFYSMFGHSGAEGSATTGLPSEEIEQFTDRVIAMNEVMNKHQALGLDEAYHIGPAYFKTYNGSNLDVIWSERVEPILREYCRGRNKTEVDKFILQCRNVLFGEEA